MSQINVQVYKVGTTSHMWGGVIVKSRKSHYKQAPYHAHSTYIQINNQAIGDQKPIKKGTDNPETKKSYTKHGKFSQNLTKNMCKKGIWLPPPNTHTPKSHNVLIGSWGDTTKNKNTKTQNKENWTRHKYIQTNTQNKNTSSPNQLKSYTYIHKQHHQQQIFTKPRTPPITKHNYTQKTYKGDHSPLGSTNPKLHLKIDHPHNHNPKYP